ncbi:hypothetical protein HO133_009517 [Letharia lupina]|uniref:Uncharacterized protein n=1 Tax=Letharia lupina TaxID=560253 RepID=A0A8H6FEH1_9LECA|nr:uncharacterized protein HO133_009517 [Letharia lupina]KAF6225517.1 hypothetical protein HO133_009517 [Letharia lupina]
MGLTSRKFSFSSLRIKTSTQAAEAPTDYDIDTSPPYSPTESEMERPSVQPHMLIDLRHACAIIVNETNPPDPDEEPDHRETLRRHEEERKARHAAQARLAKPQKIDVKSQQASANRAEQRLNEKAQKAYARKVETEARKELARKVESRMAMGRKEQSQIRQPENREEHPRQEKATKYETRRPREDIPLFGPEGAASYTSAIPKTASYEALHGQRRPSETGSAARIEFLPPVHATIVNNSRPKPREAVEPPEPVNTAISNNVKGKQRESDLIELSPVATTSNFKGKQKELDGSNGPTHTAISEGLKATLKKMERPVQPTRTMSNSTNSKQKEIESLMDRIDPKPPQILTTSNPRRKQKEVEDPALNHIRDSLHFRPKTSAAACIDYSGASGESSKSTSRSYTDYDNKFPRPTSTAATSAALTPGDDKKAPSFDYNRRPSYGSSHHRRPSDESHQSEESEQAKLWRRKKLLIQQAEDRYNNSGRAARPGSRASKRSRSKLSMREDSDSEYERPLSRASSIGSSIASGISNYIRPRASQDSMRSGFSNASGLSRSGSRSSSVGRRGSWWKGSGLRRKGSWSSFRSARPEEEEPRKLKKNGGPNLNRPLPALPGLDQYKEAKTHIGQLMKSGGRGRKAKREQEVSGANPYARDQTRGHVKKDSISAPIVSNDGIERTLHRYRGASVEHLRGPGNLSQQPSINNMRSGSPYMSSLSQTRQENPFGRPESPPSRSYTRHEDPSPSYLKRPDSPLQRNPTRPDDPYSRSQSRQQGQSPYDDVRYESCEETMKKAARPRAGSNQTGSSRSKLQKQPPPMIRGPSYQKEVETGIYPRPMEVNRDANMYANVLNTPGVTVLESPNKGKKMEEGGEWERKGGAKGRLGRMFGRKESAGRMVTAN